MERFGQKPNLPAGWLASKINIGAGETKGKQTRSSHITHIQHSRAVYAHAADCLRPSKLFIPDNPSKAAQVVGVELDVPFDASRVSKKEVAERDNQGRMFNGGIWGAELL